MAKTTHCSVPTRRGVLGGVLGSVLGGVGGLVIAGTIGGTVAGRSRPARAAPSAELWPRWQAHDPASTLQVDHGSWAEFLARYRSLGADGVARVDYAAVDAQDRQRLEAYVARLARVPVSGLARDGQFAYWVDLYNALTVAVVLRHWPVDGIREIDISPGLFADGPWGAALVEVEGEALSLDDIEHRILRPIWQDPRIHYAVNCAALGCPNLAAEPFTPDNADRLLDAGARAFVNHPRGARATDGGRLVVSSIYRWFREDFGGSDAGVVAHLRRFAAGDLAARLDGRRRIDGHAYDWTINAPGRTLDLGA